MAAAASAVRSMFCTGEDHGYPVPIPLDMLTFLKLFDAHPIRFYEFPEGVVKLLLLRYLALTHNGNLPSSISKLQHLQFLILRQHHNVKLVGNPSFLPKEIWDMEQLKHLRITGHALPDPDDRRQQLQWLSTLDVNARSCTKAVFEGIRYLNKLGIVIELPPDAAQVLMLSCFEHIWIQMNIESLKCVVVNPRLSSQVVAPPHHLSNLPWYLKKLSLNGLGHPWSYMNALGSLCRLKVLKLRCCAFQGPKWETEAGQFENLEFLLLEDMDLAEWTIITQSWFSSLLRIIYVDAFYTRRRGLIYNPNCFASLQHLTVRHCYKLKKIPLEFPGLPTLTRIEVVDCSPSVVASALQIQRKRPPLELVIDSSWL